MNIQFLIKQDKCDFSFSPVRFSRGDIGRIVSAGAQVGAAAIQSGTNAKIAKETNLANKEMNDANNQLAIELAQQANDLEYKIHQEDINFNAEQAQIQRDWDSPEAQRERLIAAGYNPLALDNGFDSGGQSAASAPAAPSMDVANVNPNHFDRFQLQGLQDLAIAAGIGKTRAETKKTEEETIALPQYVFNDTERTQAEVRFKEYMTKKMVEEMPYVRMSAKWEARMKKAQSFYFKQLEETQKATQKFVEEQTAWLPVLNTSQIDEACSRIASNEKYIEYLDKQIDVSDENIGAILQEIRESSSRTALNWSNKEGQDLQNDLVSRYGKENSELAIQQYRDAHNNYICDILMNSLNIKKGDRDLWFSALQGANIFTEDDMRDFLDTLKQIKTGAVISPRQQARWYEPISALLPSLVAAGYFGGKVVSALGSRAAAPALVLPSTNIYNQPVYNHSWNPNSLMR